MSRASILAAFDPRTTSPETDAVEFERLAKTGKLAEAAAIYRGPLLDGHGVRDGAFEDWLLVERTRLHILATDVLDRFAASQSGDAAIETAQQLPRLDPVREESHRLLMRLYASVGQRAQALRQYEQCSDILRRDLQTKPDAETRRATPSRAASPRQGPSCENSCASPSATWRIFPGRTRRNGWTTWSGRVPMRTGATWITCAKACARPASP
jgi:DNA-binding SARP family transcriptional activator